MCVCVCGGGGGGGGGRGEGRHFSKTFSISYILNSKISVFNMRKTILRIIQGLNLLHVHVSFSWKKYQFR